MKIEKLQILRDMNKFLLTSPEDWKRKRRKQIFYSSSWTLECNLSVKIFACHFFRMKTRHEREKLKGWNETNEGSQPKKYSLCTRTSFFWIYGFLPGTCGERRANMFRVELFLLKHDLPTWDRSELHLHISNSNKLIVC